MRGDDRLSIADVARITHVPAGTIRRWISEGRITATSKPHTVSVSEVFDLRDTLAAAQLAKDPRSEQSSE